MSKCIKQKHKPIFDAYIKALNDLGYVSHYKIINSLDCGIPQSRNRVFLFLLIKTI
nr:DNA cytosine methyltransferase [Metamycoplasma hominis]